MVSIGTIEGTIRFNIDQATKGLQDVTKDVDKFKDTTKNASKETSGLNSSMVNAAATLITVREGYGFARDALGVYTDQLIEGYREIDQFNKLTGTSVEMGGKWKGVLEKNQIQLSDMSYAFRSLSNNMATALGDEKGTSGAYKAFNQLGISLKNSNGELKDSNTLMIELITALQKVKDPMERNALAQDTLGRGYVSLNKLISTNIDLNKSLADAETPYDIENKRKLDNFTNSMSELNSQVEDLKVNIGEGLIPVLTQMVSGLNSYLLPGINALGDRIEYVGYVTASLGNAFSLLSKGDIAGFNAAKNPTWNEFLGAKKLSTSGITAFNSGDILNKINSGQSLSPDEIAWLGKFDSSLASIYQERQTQPETTKTTKWWQNLDSGSGGGSGKKIPTFASPEELTKAIGEGWKPTQQEIADHLKEYTNAIISNQSEDWKTRNKSLIDKLEKTIKDNFDVTGTKLIGSADAIMKAAAALEAAAKPKGSSTSNIAGANAAATATIEGLSIEKREAAIKQMYAERKIGTLQYSQLMTQLYAESEGKYGLSGTAQSVAAGLAEGEGTYTAPSENSMAEAKKLRDRGLELQKKIYDLSYSGASAEQLIPLRAELEGIMQQYLYYTGSVTSTPTNQLKFTVDQTELTKLKNEYDTTVLKTNNTALLYSALKSGNYDNILKYSAMLGYSPSVTPDIVLADYQKLKMEEGTSLQKYNSYKNLQFMAQGGLVTSPTLLVAGEEGPEAVVPLGKKGFGAGDVHIHIDIDGNEVGTAVVNKLALLGVKI